MSKLEPIKEEKDFMRDTETGAAVNVNNRELKAYKAKKTRNKKIMKMEEELESIRNEMSEVRSLLYRIVEHRV